MNPKGIYVHIPFCKSKCAYCDFYSLPNCEDSFEDYLLALIKEAESYPKMPLETLYIGGGTPTLLGAERLARLISSLSERFGDFREITVEANPADRLYETFKALKSVGVNRISLGAQSCIDRELAALNRRHTNSELLAAVDALKTAGIDNFSLDLMLGIPHQTEESLLASIELLCSLQPRHISAYMLSLEEGTPLYKNRKSLPIPSEDEAAELYLAAAKALKDRGFEHYEISNFCKPDSPSRHNLNYWNCGEYIGLGAAAHGFLAGERYCYADDFRQFIEKPRRIFLASGGDSEEYLMLRLRLKEGVIFSDYEAAFGTFPERLLKNAKTLQKQGICRLTPTALSLTTKGFLLFNSAYLTLLA